MSPRSVRLLFAPLLLLAFACSDDSSRASEDAGVDAAGAEGAPFVALDRPSGWQGQIPCADCTAILTTVNLYPDGVFQSEGVYLGTPGAGDTVFADFGKWTLAEDGAQLQLLGSADVPGFLAIDRDGSLRMLDAEGAKIDSPFNYSLLPYGTPPALTHPARLVAAFIASDSTPALRFVECRSGLTLPVSSESDAQALARISRPSSATAFRVRGHLGEAPDGSRMFVLDSVAEPARDATCPAIAERG